MSTNQILRDALDIALDLASAEVASLKESLGERLPHKHAAAARDVQTVKDAIAALAAADADQAAEVSARNANPCLDVADIFKIAEPYRSFTNVGEMVLFAHDVRRFQAAAPAAPTPHVCPSRAVDCGQDRMLWCATCPAWLAAEHAKPEPVDIVITISEQNQGLGAQAKLAEGPKQGDAHRIMLAAGFACEHNKRTGVHIYTGYIEDAERALAGQQAGAVDGAGS